MLCQDYLPSHVLQPFVKCYHLRHFAFGRTENLPFKPYAPRPEQTLAFYPRALERLEYTASNKIITRFPSVLIGQYTERCNRHIGGPDFIALLVNFQPGVLHRITGIDFAELTNTDVDAEAVFSKQLPDVNRRLNSAESYDDMIGIVEAFLVGLLKPLTLIPHPIDRVCDWLLARPQDAAVLQLAADACLSRRQFERKFKQRMGISPRLYLRIARMHQAFRHRYHAPQTDWLSIALASGYYDYQHLAKDFLEFAGVLPSAYLLEDTQAPEQIVGLRDSSL